MSSSDTEPKDEAEEDRDARRAQGAVGPEPGAGKATPAAARAREPHDRDVEDEAAAETHEADRTAGAGTAPKGL